MNSSTRLTVNGVSRLPEVIIQRKVVTPRIAVLRKFDVCLFSKVNKKI